MLEQAKAMALLYAPKFVLAIVVLIVGFWLAKRIVGFMDKRLEKRGVDPSLRPFLASLLGIGLKMAIVISVLSMVGVEMTSFIAIIGAAGLAVGLALQGSLGNFAGGVLILLFKPFKVGDVIEAQGFLGAVAEIQIFNTIMKTPDNKTIIIPNGKLSNDALTNYSTEELRRVDMTFGVGYSDDLDKTRAALAELVAADARILKDGDQAPAILVAELADSSVNFYVRVWAKGSDYWGVYFDMHEAVKKTFDAKSISIPFPQMDIHKV